MYYTYLHLSNGSYYEWRKQHEAVLCEKCRFKLIMASPYVSSSFSYGEPICYSQLNYGEPICYIQLNYGEPICELNFNYGEPICFIEF